MTRPDGYHVQDGCHNCANARGSLRDWPDTEDGLVCLYGETPQAGETVGDMIERIRWESRRDVDEAGTCPQWAAVQQQEPTE